MERRRRADIPPEFILPYDDDAAGRGAVDMQAAGSLLGVLPALAASLTRRLDPNVAASFRQAAHVAGGPELPQVERAVVVLCDGLGYQNLIDNKAYAPFLRSRVERIDALTSTFPSTTASAVVSFGTGQPPGITGFVGYSVQDPATGALVNLVPWTWQRDPTVVATEDGNRDAPPFPVDVAQFQPEPPVFQRLANAGIRVVSVGPERFEASALSRAAFGKTEFLAVAHRARRVPAAAELIRKGRADCVYLYWGEVDKAGHEFGPYSMEYSDAVAEFDRELATLVKSVPPGTLVLLTADHGQISPDPAQQVDVAQTPALAADVALVAGEARAALVYLRPGADTDRVAARWREVLGDRVTVWTRAEAIDQGLFGVVRERVRPWIGDLVVAARDGATVVDSRTQTANSLTLPGVHGSLTPAEMTIPLLTEVT